MHTYLLLILLFDNDKNNTWYLKMLSPIVYMILFYTYASYNEINTKNHLDLSLVFNLKCSFFDLN